MLDPTRAPRRAAPTRPLAFALVLALLLAGLAGCRPPKDRAEASQASSGASVTIAFDGDPQLGTVPAVVTVTEGGQGVSGATVQVTGDMTHAGMIPVVRDAAETAPGTYRADDFAFTMAGDWILTADVTLPGGTKVSAESQVTVPGR